jgi:hypothetical protein
LIVLERSTNFIKRFHLFYHIVAWGFPLIGVIILLASKVSHTPHIARAPPHALHRTRTTAHARPHTHDRTRTPAREPNRFSCRQNIGALSGVPSCFMAADHEAYGWVLFYGPCTLLSHLRAARVALLMHRSVSCVCRVWPCVRTQWRYV